MALLRDSKGCSSGLLCDISPTNQILHMAFQHIVNGAVVSAEVVLVKDSQSLPSRLLSFHVLSSWLQSSTVPYALLSNWYLRLFGRITGTESILTAYFPPL